MVDKSDAMKTHEKWIEETLRNKPKHTSEGLPVQPWHVLLALGVLLVLMIVIGTMLHH